MIFPLQITLSKFISTDHKSYNWPSCDCPKCKRKMWGHGYVHRYLTEDNNTVSLKRYLCPHCRTVICVRPDDFWPYLRTPIKKIFAVLKEKISTGFWPLGYSRQRSGHWLRQFVSHAKMLTKENLLDYLNECFIKNLPLFPSKKVELFSRVYHPT